MFFIVNKTKGSITLGDIGITLGPRQAVDLDKVMNRDVSDRSRSLRAAQSKGDIEVRMKDVEKVSPVINVPSPVSHDFKGLKEEIVGEMKNVMRDILSGQNGISKEDIKALIESMPKSQETVIYRQESGNRKEDVDAEMDERVLSEINKRAVNEIVKNTEAKSVHCEEKKAENTILNNVDELENLLG